MPDMPETMNAMADEIFELYQLVAIARAQNPAGSDDLSETEYLTLDTLLKGQQLSIGDVQKQIGVVPAQMSRVVRSLETNGGKGYVSCSINPKDRRRVDLSITDSGRQAHEKYRNTRLASMQHVLTIIPPEDRLDFMRILGIIRKAFEKRLGQS